MRVGALGQQPGDVAAGPQRPDGGLDVDTLQDAGRLRRETLQERLAEAEALLQRELGAALENWAERQLGPAIVRLRQRYVQSVRAALPELEPEAAERLAHRFAHLPVQGLRAVARTHGLEAAQAFLAETDLLTPALPLADVR